LASTLGNSQYQVGDLLPEGVVTKMEERARQQRNKARLVECFPAFSTRLKRVLKALEAQGFRPRIQDAWRSRAAQLAAFNAGTSKLKFGYHNVTGAGEKKEALAADVLDDNRPLAPTTRYKLALAQAARAQGLETGILFDLPPALAAGVEAALAAGNLGAELKTGWDPTHVQVTSPSVAGARAGTRPTFKPAQAARGAAKFHTVKSGESLSKIAKIHGITMARILQLNPEKRPNPNLIRIGEKIRVR
jgi:LysM domain-containing protein